MRTIGQVILSLFIAIFLFTSCGTTKKISKETRAKQAEVSTMYIHKVYGNRITAEAITAKVKVDLTLDDKNISLSGRLRMKRDDVIQLSLSFLGMEVGRAEFTKEEALLVDSWNKRYVRVPYNKIEFLHEANIDFTALQALFWHELFAPGVTGEETISAPFTLGVSGNYTLLSLGNSPKLDFTFLTNTADGQIERTTIATKSLTSPTTLTWKYENLTNYEKKKFPQTISATVDGLKKHIEMNLSLSNLKNDTTWETRTKLSSKYKEKSVNDLVNGLMNL